MDLNRDDAWQLLTEYTKSESLLKHALASRPRCAATRGSSARTRTAGASSALLHDFDYERWPSLEDHPFRGSEILRERRAIRSG